MSQAINPKATTVKGKRMTTEWRQDATTQGNTVTTTDGKVDHGDSPRACFFGLLQSRIYNERDSNVSRLEEKLLDTDDLHLLINPTHKGLEELGAENITSESIPVDITEGAVAQLTETGNLILGQSISAQDRFHGVLTTERVGSWQPRTTRAEGSPDGLGNDVLTTKQVKAAVDALPTTNVNTLALTREQIGNDKFLQTHVTLPDGSGTLTHKNSFGASGSPTVETVKRVALDFSFPTPELNVVRQTLRHVDGFGKIFTKEVLPDGWPTLVSYEEEPTTGKKVTVTRSVLGAAPTFATNGTARIVDTVKHTGTNRWARVTREIDESILSETFYEYHSVDYYFPAYLDEDNPFLVMNIGGTTMINPLRSSSHTFKLPCRFEITYHSTVPTASEVFQFKTIDIVLKTLDGTIDERKVITDGTTIGIRVAVGNIAGLLAAGFIASSFVHLGNGTWASEIQFEFGGSSPTTTEYKAMMSADEEVLIADDSTRWKYNLWRRVKVYMKIPNVSAGLSGSLIY